MIYSYEMNPCTFDGQQYARCEEDYPAIYCWRVYRRGDDHLAECLSDHYSKEEAEKEVKRLITVQEKMNTENKPGDKRIFYGIECVWREAGYWAPGVEHEEIRMGDMIIIDVRTDRRMRWVQSINYHNCVLCHDGEKYMKNGQEFLVVENDSRESVRILSGDPSVLLVVRGEDDTCVNARLLHSFLGVGRHFRSWITGRLESMQAVEGQDFELAPQTGRSTSKEYLLSLDTAKHLAMLERNDRGKEIRQYFIDVEKAARKAYHATQAPSINMSDPLEVAKLYIASEEARRAAEESLEVKTIELKETSATVDALTDKVEAPERCVTLKQFFKETASVLGYSALTGYQYMREAGILVQGQHTKWDKVYSPSAEHDRKGLFQIKMATYPRPVTKDDDASPKGRKFVEVEKPVVLLTPDKKDKDGNTVAPGGYSWLLRKMLKDPRTTLSRLVATEGGRDGKWAKLYGCTLHRVDDFELLKVAGATDKIRFHRDGGWFVCRYNGLAHQEACGPTLTVALENLLEITESKAKKATAV